MEKDELIAENKRLRKEIARLKLLLKQHNIAFEENCKKKLSIEETFLKSGLKKAYRQSKNA